MEKYQKPICTCGSELILIEEVVYHHEKRINSDGQFAKKIKRYEHTKYGTYWLKCTNEDCGMTFEVEYDENSRVIRGEVYGF